MRRHNQFFLELQILTQPLSIEFFTDYMYVDLSPSDCVMLGTVHCVSVNKSHLI